MKYLCIVFCVMFGCLAADNMVLNMAKAYERTHATCPGPLKAEDYYTPEE